MNTPHMRPVDFWIVRILGILLFAVLFYQSWRLAWASSLAGSQLVGKVERAISLEPDNTRYRLLHVSLVSNTGAPPESIEAELKEVLRRNPRSSEALMQLGTLAEAKGQTQEAETLLLRAASFDRTYTPLWTLINFYFRTSQTEKLWPRIGFALDLTANPNLDYFDPTNLYELCWQTGADRKQWQKLVLERPHAIPAYFLYLTTHQHLEAATEIYPYLLPLANASVPSHAYMFAQYCNLLASAYRGTDAVEVWNQMVAKRLTISDELHPEKADSIENPSFAHPFGDVPFRWFGPYLDPIRLTYTPGSLLFEMDGRQPETALLLRKLLPVLPDRDYVLTWEAEGSGIVKPHDLKEAGVKVIFSDHDKPLPASCSAFFAPEGDRGCHFHVPSGGSAEKLRLVQMQVLVERAVGSVRLQGSFRIQKFRLGFQRNSPTA